MSSLKCSVDIETVSSKEIKFHLLATSEERVPIAKRINLLSLEHLEATLHLVKKGHLELSGKITADVTQKCVRTLVPFSQHFEIEVAETFTLMPEETQEEIELEAEVLTEPLYDTTLDLGEVVIQLLSLTLDPYPVAPESGPVDYKEDNSSSSPFAVLKKKE